MSLHRFDGKDARALAGIADSEGRLLAWDRGTTKMPKTPHTCSVCQHRWPGHSSNCISQDHPAICAHCGEALYVSYAARLVRHFSNEETSCPPKETA